MAVPIQTAQVLSSPGLAMLPGLDAIVQELLALAEPILSQILLGTAPTIAGGPPQTPAQFKGTDCYSGTDAVLSCINAAADTCPGTPIGSWSTGVGCFFSTPGAAKACMQSAGTRCGGVKVSQ